MKYVKRPIPIEAVQWDGFNFSEIQHFMENNKPIVNSKNQLVISTLEGEMCADVGSYIIKGVIGEFYPCREDVFNDTYEPIQE